MIEDVERGKKDIREHLESARRNPKKRAHELVELLEDKAALDKLFMDKEISKEVKSEHNREQNFYRAYIIYIFNKFIFDDDDTEIMLVAFNYHPDFEHETRAKYRRDLFVRQVYELKHRKGWGDSVEKKDAGLRGEEARIMDELSGVLAELAAKQGGTLNLVEEVLATLDPSGTKENTVDAVGGEDDAVDSETVPDAPVPAEVSHLDAPTTDNGISEEIGKVVAPDPENDSAIAGDQQDSCSKEKSQYDTPPPPPQPAQTTKIHIVHDSHDTVSYITVQKSFHINIRRYWWIIPVFIIVIGFIYAKFFFSPTPPVEEIFPSEEEIILVPGEQRLLKVAVLPMKAMDAPLSFVSEDPATVTVSHTGVLEAHDNPQGQLRQPVDITIQAESGATKIKTVMVDFSGGNSNPPEVNAEVEAGYYVWQRIRLSGADEWADTVDAEIGDIVEIQIQYKNISETTQENVMILDVLPPNLDYIPGTTQIYNVKHDGSVLSDGITAKGVNLGNYTPGSNAYVRFSAKVVDINLAPGSNTLVNWSKAGVGPITLNDYTTVVVQK